VQKNHGVSHVIVEGDEEARRLFGDLAPGELGVQPLCFEEAFFSRITSGMATAKTAPGDASTRAVLPAAELDAMLARGELPPPEVVRPEVARILVEEAKRRGS
jgi:sulfate adenylyltransferase/3'-phosphoadenosine 5'-phosphosulfate synthase